MNSLILRFYIMHFWSAPLYPPPPTHPMPSVFSGEWPNPLPWPIRELEASITNTQHNNHHINNTGTQHTHVPRSQRIYIMKIEEYTIKESFCVLKGLKHENFGSEFLLPAKAVWVGNLLRTESKIYFSRFICLLFWYFRRKACSVHAHHAV